MDYNPINLLNQYYIRATNFLKSLVFPGELEQKIGQQNRPEELGQRLHEDLGPLRVQLAAAATYRAAMGDRQIRPWRYMRPR